MGGSSLNTLSSEDRNGRQLVEYFELTDRDLHRVLRDFVVLAGFAEGSQSVTELIKGVARPPRTCINQLPGLTGNDWIRPPAKL